MALGREDRQGRFDDVLLLVGDQLLQGTCIGCWPSTVMRLDRLLHHPRRGFNGDPRAGPDAANSHLSNTQRYQYCELRCDTTDVVAAFGQTNPVESSTEG